jgi:hypothetical protein
MHYVHESQCRRVATPMSRRQPVIFALCVLAICTVILSSTARLHAQAGRLPPSSAPTNHVEPPSSPALPPSSPPSTTLPPTAPSLPPSSAPSNHVELPPSSPPSTTLPPTAPSLPPSSAPSNNSGTDWIDCRGFVSGLFSVANLVRVAVVALVLLVAGALSQRGGGRRRDRRQAKRDDGGPARRAQRQDA